MVDEIEVQDTHVQELHVRNRCCIDRRPKDSRRSKALHARKADFFVGDGRRDALDADQCVGCAGVAPRPNLHPRISPPPSDDGSYVPPYAP